MSTANNPAHTSVPTSSRPATTHAHPEPYANGHSHHHHDNGGQSSAGGAKKGKQKKASDPNDDAKMIQAKIAQLELDAAEGKDQEAEIGSFHLFHCFRLAFVGM
jgi:hypothetical protein